MSEVMISADSHVVEDPQLWKKRLPAKWKDDAPVFPELGVGGHFQAQPGGWDPKARVQEMAQDGVSGEVLYPSFGLDLYGLKDPALQEACFRVYNEWITEYCSAAPAHLFGIGAISAYNIDNAVSEVERCKRAGMKGIMVWQAPPDELAFSTGHYERLWAAAQEMDLPVSMHILTGPAYPWPRPINVQGRRVAYRSFKFGVNNKLHYVTNSICDLIATGVLERYPTLKFVLVENEISWIPFVLSQYDKYWSRGNMEAPITMAPGEYFKRQFYATFFNDPPAAWVLEHWGTNNCMWSNDYPHPNSTWPESRKVIERDLGKLPPATRKKLLSENARGLYQLPEIKPAAIAA